MLKGKLIRNKENRECIKECVMVDFLEAIVGYNDLFCIYVLIHNITMCLPLY